MKFPSDVQLDNRIRAMMVHRSPASVIASLARILREHRDRPHTATHCTGMAAHMLIPGVDALETMASKYYEMYHGEPSPLPPREPETVVIFRRERGKDGDVFALFPYLPATGYYVTSYQHVGQHGAADYRHCIRTSRPASPEESAALRRELEQRGYRLRAIRFANNARMQNAFREARG